MARFLPAEPNPEEGTDVDGTTTDLTIFILALLVGIEVIGKVPATLHTPLMSVTNAIDGIVLAGAPPSGSPRTPWSVTSRVRRLPLRLANVVAATW